MARTQSTRRTTPAERRASRERTLQNTLRMLQEHRVAVLNVQARYLDADAIAALLPALEGQTKLVTLHVANNALGDAGAVEIAKMLRVNTTLKQLDLSGIGMGDVGALAIADALKVNTSLERLGLYLNWDVSEAGEWAILQALSANQSLQVIQMALDERAAAALQEAASAIAIPQKLSFLGALSRCHDRRVLPILDPGVVATIFQFAFLHLHCRVIGGGEDSPFRKLGSPFTCYVIDSDDSDDDASASTSHQAKRPRGGERAAT